jgi:predicted amino acid dehydrogenase
MKHVVSIMFTSSRNNYEKVVDFFGEKVRISQFGADFDPATMEALLKQHDGKCDVIAVSGLHLPVRVGRRLHHHPDSQRYLQIPQQTPVTNGFLLRKVFIPWAIQNQVREKRISFENRKVAFASGLVDQELVHVISQYTDRLYFADAYYHLRLPIILKGLDELNAYTKRFLPVLKRVSLGAAPRSIDFRGLPLNKRLKEAGRADFIVGSATILERVDPRVFKGRTVIVDSLSHALETQLRNAKVKDIIQIVPRIPGVDVTAGLRYSVLEALIQVTRTNGVALEEDDLLDFITKTGLKAELRSVSKEEYRPVRKFAFIIHPLSVRDFFRHPMLRPLQRVAKMVERPIEKGLTFLPGMRYGTIRGITSELDGTRVEGLIYTLFDTPREMLKADPQAVYEKLVKVAEQAARDGADIIGLGAFTKVVGDAGVTVASLSPIPVTTGNSLSASAALWAARVAVEKMGFTPPYSPERRRLSGTAMVIGATGSIGKVSAKLLTGVAQRLILVSPTSSKLIELRDEFQKLNPRCKIEIGTNPSRFAGECDLIILSTSSLDGGVMDLKAVKPGCVISDVSRPLTYSAAEVASRPDVLVIESGEVNLPGEVDLNCDIGLEESVVYACLAETALLSLEGRFESFTLSRNISFERVREIYDIAKRHGAKLAAIRGPAGIITDQEIALCREHALEALKNWKPSKSGRENV